MNMKKFILGAVAVLVTAGSALVSVVPAASAAGPPGKASYIVVLKQPPAGSNVSADVATAAASAHARYGASVKHTYTHIFSGYAATMDASAVSALRADPKVASVVPDGKVHATSTCTGEVTHSSRMTGRSGPGVDRLVDRVIG
jgi:hypothetical protein